MLLDGKEYADVVIPMLKERVSKLKKKPVLAIIQVAGNNASDIYVQNKIKRCAEVGILTKFFYFLEDVEEWRIRNKIYELNGDDSVTGIILQLPLPDHLDEYKLTNLISPEKDVDGFTDINIGKLSSGQECNVPCTAKGIIDLLDHYGLAIEGKDVLIINRSNIVGKPLAQLFLQRNATVTIAHSRTKNLKEKIKKANIIVTGVGIPNFLTGTDFADVKCPVIIDVSINFVDGKMCGDVRKASYGYLKLIGYLTPVPGGVGQSTVIALLDNVIKIEEQKESEFFVNVIKPE